MTIPAAPAELHTRRPIRARLGLRSRMRAFVVGQTVFLINDRPVTPGHLRAGDVGKVIALDGDCAWAEFPLGSIQHKELIKLGDVGLVCCPDQTCGTRSDKHSDDCSLAMNTPEMHERILPGAREGVR